MGLNNQKPQAVLSLLTSLLFLWPAELPAGQGSESPVDWSVNEVKNITHALSASNSLKPAQWPDGNQVAVLLAFDVDNETLFLSPRAKQQVPVSQMAFGSYGANQGLDRIIDTLKQHDIPATFFIPAMMLDIHPDTVKKIQRLNHYEVGVHGWIHERNVDLPSLEVETRLIAQSVQRLTDAFGKAPVGYRAPAWDFSPYTLQVLKSQGFLYDSSLMARDDPYELCERRHGAGSTNSQTTGIIELPVSWILDDFPLLHSWPGSGSYSSPRQVLQVYKDEFDRAYAEGGMFLLTLHPHVIGRRSRILILEQLIDYMQSKQGVWFATHKDAALYVRQQTKPQEVRCP